MKNLKTIALGTLISCAACVVPGASAAPILGSALSFAVLGGSAVTNTGPTTIKGDLGVDPGTSITGLGSITLAGTAHQADAITQGARADAFAAENFLSSLLATHDLSGQDMGGLTLTPGVYAFSSSAQLTGTLKLDAQGDPDALFVFRIGSALTTASAAMVDLINGSGGAGVYWDVGSSATLGTSTSFLGNILADQSIVLDTGARILCGRAIALNAAVTMDSNVISNDCAGDGGAGSVTAVPEPGTLWLIAFGCMAIAWRRMVQVRALKPAACAR